jgi:hypothetical protein
MAGKQLVAGGEEGAESPLPWASLDMICPWAGGAVHISPVKKGPVPVWGIVLFFGAAIPGGPRMGGQPGTCAGMRRLPVGGIGPSQTMGCIGAVSTRVPSQLLPKSAGRCIAGMMETHAELPERVRRDQQHNRPARPSREIS